MRQLVIVTTAGALALAAALGTARAQDATAAKEKVPVLPPAKSAGAKDLKDSELAAIRLDLPTAQTIGTPAAPKEVNVDRATHGKRRGPFLVPKGVALISKGKPAKLSDESPLIGDATMVTDGDKEGAPGSLVELGLGQQWAQVDLGEAAEIWAIVVWHNHAEIRVYRDVIVQVSNDPQFKNGVETLFNNDHDNSSGTGPGKDFEYFESDEGKLIDGKGMKARYVRCYTKGSTDNGQNHITEVEVWGKLGRK